MSKRKVLVIGGTGFLGSHLVPKLVADGHEVTVLTRRQEEIPRLASNGVKGLIGDILDYEAFLPGAGQQDVVVFIAMPFKPGRISSSKMTKLRRQTTAFVTGALAVTDKLDSFLIMTAGTSYRTVGEEIADETWPIARFGIAQIGAEVDPMLEAAFAKGKPPLILMLPGQIYGPGGLFLMMVGMMKKGRYRVCGDGSNRIPRVHVDDCAVAYAQAVGKLPLGQKFIVADDYPCTVREFSDGLAECLEIPKPGTAPFWLIRLILGKAMAETMAMDCRVSNRKAKEVLGWQLQYPTFREGLAATCRALQKGK